MAGSAAEVLESHGVGSYVVNGGGDIGVAVGQLRGPWRIDIVHPRDSGRIPGRVSLSRGAIAPSVVRAVLPGHGNG